MNAVLGGGRSAVGFVVVVPRRPTPDARVVVVAYRAADALADGDEIIVQLDARAGWAVFDCATAKPATTALLQLIGQPMN